MVTYSALVAQCFWEAGVTAADRPETIALSLLALAHGLGGLSLAGAGFASGPDVAEAPRLVAERLLAIPGARAEAASERRTDLRE